MDRLPPNSICCFHELSKVFMAHYFCSARQHQGLDSLNNLKMMEYETLRDFMKRFGQTVTQIKTCSMEAIM